MPFSIVRQDITKMEVDAIVNAANTDLAMGGGVCGAIFRAAGEAKLQQACDKVSPIKTGGAAITPGFALKARYIIHAAGPIYADRSAEEGAALLRSAYTQSLTLAAENGCASIAFPLISSGIYGYPKAEALRIATAAIREFLAEHDITIYLAVFDRESFGLSRELSGAVESYIDDNYVRQHKSRREKGDYSAQEEKLNALAMPMDAMLAQGSEAGVGDALSRMDEPFSSCLLRLIDKKGRSDVEVYKRANIDRKLFSKIRTGKGYTPGKRTILALAVALELTLPETDDLLEKGGYALSHSRKFDVIVEYFIVSGRYDIFEINEVLFKYDQPLLGC